MGKHRDNDPNASFDTETRYQWCYAPTGRMGKWTWVTPTRLGFSSRHSMKG